MPACRSQTAIRDRQAGLSLIGACLLLAGCATYTAHEARTKLVGINQNDLMSCAGPPDQKVRLDRHEAIFAYDYRSDTSTFSLDVLTLGTMTLGPRGECKAVFRLRDGVVTHVGYEATTSSLDGPLGACGPIVSECLSHRPVTPLPADFDAMTIFNPGG